MGYHTTVAVLTVAGLAGTSAFADPAEVTVAGPTAATAMGPSALSYVGSLVGPSHIAPPVGERAARGAPGSHLLFMVAGPDNTARGPLLALHGGGLGDGPGGDPVAPVLTTADVVGVLSPFDYTALERQVDPTTERDPGAGGFQVAVPLPGAGALAGAGLAFVAIRRRRR